MKLNPVLPEESAAGAPREGAAPDAATPEVTDSPLTRVEIAQIIVALGVTIALLRFAAPFFIPFLFGVLTAYSLQPLVNLLARARVPRALGGALALALALSLVGGTFYALSDDAAEMIEQLPEAARTLRHELHGKSGPRRNPIASVQRAAVELDEAAKEAQSAAPARPAPPAPPQESPLLKSAQEFVFTQTASAFALVLQLLIACMIAYFLLASGDAFRRKLARIAGPSLARRRVTIEILDEIDAQIQRYMLVLIGTNLLIGVAIWILFAAVGVERAPLWGTLAAILHIVPYAGIALIALGAAIVGLMQFGDLGTAAMLSGGTLAIATLIGMGLNTWLQGRASRMNSVVVFTGILFFGWLWGGWGLLLGAPLLAVIKTVAERVNGLADIAEIMDG